MHGKPLPVPSFFQVYNFGGGNGDKDREIVYAELTENTPALINYFYINNNFPHVFKSSYFNDLSGFETIGDVYNSIRRSLIVKGRIYSGYKSKGFDFNRKVFLLDSGAFSIVKYIALKVGYNEEKFKSALIEQMQLYYDFADSLKIDMVVAFDLGGKYTEKDGEKSNKDLKTFLQSINSDAINNMLLEEATMYLSKKENYYPYVLATVHGTMPTDYANCAEFILSLENKYNYKFWGFALGGIASYKRLNEAWYNDISFSSTVKKELLPAAVSARAAKIVRNIVGDLRPIHALGCGGYSNIAANYFSGATSFDSATPVRRVGDGNLVSTQQVFSATPSASAKFSKYFVGGINYSGALRNEECKYLALNKIDDRMPLCGCPACKEAVSIKYIKELYSKKSVDQEANYFSRQLMGLHSVQQHNKLCETVSKYNSLQEFSTDYSNNLFKGLNDLLNQL